MPSTFEFNWCRDAEKAGALAELFSRNLTPSYISHSELQGPRAIDPSTWAPDIAETIRQDVISRIDSPLDAAPDSRTFLTAYLTLDGRDVAVFLVTFSRTAYHPYAILEDMMVDPSVRGRGIGEGFMRWIEEECRKRGIRRMFLESGGTNENAHHFFEREGFEKISVVMMKNI